MKLLDDGSEGSRCQVEETEAFFEVGSLFGLVALVDGIVPCFPGGLEVSTQPAKTTFKCSFSPLNDGAQLVEVDQVIGDAGDGRHFGGQVEECAQESGSAKNLTDGVEGVPRKVRQNSYGASIEARLLFEIRTAVVEC